MTPTSFFCKQIRQGLVIILQKNIQRIYLRKTHSTKKKEEKEKEKSKMNEGMS